jgi:hypothetical protein
VDWILELKAFLVSGKLPEEESEAERIVRFSAMSPTGPILLQ